jgi:hypothetical protein
MPQPAINARSVICATVISHGKAYTSKRLLSARLLRLAFQPGAEVLYNLPADGPRPKLLAGE